MVRDRQLAITGREMSRDAVEEAIDSGKLSTFSEAISGETLQARQSLADTEARHGDIVKLEKTIVELSHLFGQVAQLVDAQGETVHRIETHIQGAVDYVEEGAQEIEQALGCLQRAKRCKRYLIGTIIGTLVCIALCLGIFAAIQHLKESST